MPLSPDALQFIVEANDESARIGHEYVGTEHLLLAFARRGGAGGGHAELAVD